MLDLLFPKKFFKSQEDTYWKDEKSDNSTEDLYIEDLPEAPRINDFEEETEKPNSFLSDDESPLNENRNFDKNTSFFNTDDSDRRKELFDLKGTKRKDIFQDHDRYVYFCEFVDRYVDMHGLRNIKERNIRYLKQLSSSKDPDTDKQLLWNLVENNRPLAMRQALVTYSFSDWSKEDAQDAYEDAVLNLANTYFRRLDEIKKMNVMEFQRLNFFTCKNSCKLYDTKLSHYRLDTPDTFIPFEEDDEILYRNPEKFLNLDTEFFKDMTKILTQREQYILSTYLFGDETNGIQGIAYNPFVIEDISEAILLTRERTRQIVNKIFRKILNNNRKYNIKERLFTTDPEYKFSIETHKSKNYEIQREFFRHA